MSLSASMKDLSTIESSNRRSNRIEAVVCPDRANEQISLWSPFISPTAFLASPSGIITVSSEDNIIAKLIQTRRKAREIKNTSPSHWIKNLIFRLNVYAAIEAERILLCFGLPP